MALFSVLLPIHRPPALLPYAIRSVQAQDRKDFELYVICDGAPKETGEWARSCARNDTRIKVRIYPKGKRHGEAYRHEVLRESSSTYVCQIADDDIWFPSHLTEMERLLQSADFGQVPQVYVDPSGCVGIRPSNLADETQRRRMCEEKFNTFGPTECGYRLAAYRKLAEGWSPAPDDIWTDLYMWRKFFATPGLRFATRYTVTSLHFPASLRHDMSLQQRAEEIEAWLNRIQVAEERDRILQEALGKLASDAFQQHFSASQMRQLTGVVRQQTQDVRQLTDVANYYRSSRIWKGVESIRRILRRIRGKEEPAFLKEPAATR